MRRNAAGTGHTPLLNAGDGGFTLPEALLAMLFGCAVVLAAARFYPALRGQSQNSVQYVRLEQLFHQAALSIEKDVRRAGFCAGSCQGDALTIGRHAGEAEQSCINIAYDLNRNGRWDGGAEQEAESFGYRLRAGALEIQRGAHNCDGGRWEKLFDPLEVALTHFQITPWHAHGGFTLYELQIAGYWVKRPEIHRRIVRLMMGRNA